MKVGPGNDAVAGLEMRAVDKIAAGPAASAGPWLEHGSERGCLCGCGCRTSYQQQQQQPQRNCHRLQRVSSGDAIASCRSRYHGSIVSAVVVAVDDHRAARRCPASGATRSGEIAARGRSAAASRCCRCCHGGGQHHCQRDRGAANVVVVPSDRRGSRRRGAKRIRASAALSSPSSASASSSGDELDVEERNKLVLGQVSRVRDER